MIRLVPTLLLLGLLSCHKDAPDASCVDPARVVNSACPANIDPVCGCNRVTYNNACEAARAGVVSTTPGTCQ